MKKSVYRGRLIEILKPDGTKRVGYLTIDGLLQKRSCQEYPYSYSNFCIYKTNDWRPDNQAFYFDRLSLWYPDKYFEYKKKYLGTSDYLTSYDPDQIEKFISALFGYNIHITGMEEECNCSNGYYSRIVLI